MSTIWNNNISQWTVTVQQCARCCQLFTRTHICKALTRICYVCRCYGHYSNSIMCNGRTAKPTISTSKTSYSPFKEQTSTNETSTGQELPFADISTDEMIKCLPKPTIQGSAKINSVSKVNSMLQNDLLKEQNSRKQIQQQLDQCQQNLDQVTAHNKVLCQKLDQADISVKRLKNSESDMQDENENLRNLIAHSDSKIQSLEATNNVLESTITRLNEGTQKIENEKMKLFELMQKLDQCVFSKDVERDDIQNDLEFVLGEFYDQCQPGPPKDMKQCRYCGSTSYHTRKECLAKGQECPNCGKQNHFAVVCKSLSRGLDFEPTVKQKQLFNETNRKYLEKEQECGRSPGIFCLLNFKCEQ